MVNVLGITIAEKKVEHSGNSDKYPATPDRPKTPQHLADQEADRLPSEGDDVGSRSVRKTKKAVRETTSSDSSAVVASPVTRSMRIKGGER
jgi:hypothetical protein